MNVYVLVFRSGFDDDTYVEGVYSTLDAAKTATGYKGVWATKGKEWWPNFGPATYTVMEYPLDAPHRAHSA